jgi:dTMP kinase
MAGKVIVLEGLNGCGKSSTAMALYELMKDEGRKVLLYRDPGDTTVGDKIRALVKDPHVPMIPWAQCLMYMAARLELAHEIEPFLKEGGSVILDRWWPSTYCYQGAGGVDKGFIRSTARSLVHEVCPSDLCDTDPRLTFYLDLHPKTAWERSGALKPGGGMENGSDRFEAQGVAFQIKLGRLYLELCQLGEMTSVNVASFKSPEETAAHLWDKHVKGVVP